MLRKSPWFPLRGLLDHLERTLVPGPWIVDGQFTLAEISIAPYMFRLAALGADQFWSRERRPHVKAWYENLAARPAFKTAVSWPDESGGGWSGSARRSSAPDTIDGAIIYTK